MLSNLKSSIVLALSVYCGPVLADNVLHPGTPVLDRPTLITLGIQLPISGDDNFNAAVMVRYRKLGATAWNDALPLFRVHPESTPGWPLVSQFAGSIFDLRPSTTYQIELHATDPDGPVNQTLTLTATTRDVPGDPHAPRVRNVANAADLQSALYSAQAGDIINLANGVYAGQFLIFAAGTQQNPIVIRGASQSGVILDGQGCVPCNVFEVYGAGFVHIERMTIQNAERAVRFQTAGARENVLRGVLIRNTQLGVGGRESQLDFYIADNILQGRLSWPLIYRTDGGVHASDDGIAVTGFGHVVAHNRISGYGDAMKTEQDGARAIDFYGNDILYTYDNGVELDGSEGNTRCFRNRFTNGQDMLSVQPVFGGPAYLIRNLVVNPAGEQVKFHNVGAPTFAEPNGVLVYHNTFVSPFYAMQLQTPSPSHHFVEENNLFVGPSTLATLNAVDWTGPADDGTFDYNGYFPNGRFYFNTPVLGGYIGYPNFAALQAAGVERHGVLLTGQIFASGLVGPANYTTQMAPQDLSLAKKSAAIDKGIILPNINSGFQGRAPDLGAVERGCASLQYGPRAANVDERNQSFSCY
jgi:hypothetical protein